PQPSEHVWHSFSADPHAKQAVKTRVTAHDALVLASSLRRRLGTTWRGLGEGKGSTVRWGTVPAR
ncbi:MAG TPA: hypothetical protein VFD20_01230, partial [Demequina sp.]|nr:hypothetical protein [Demequina sp.]